jgi:GNAT superfamily N-acetyltransferase
MSWAAAYAHVFTAEQLGSISQGDDAARWRRFLTEAPPRSAAFVAADSRQVVGFSSLGVARPGDDPALGELFTIYVLPERWGAGVGQALMATTLAQLRTEEFRAAVLWVLEDNPRTRRFYEQAGWRADGGVKEEEWLGTTIREVRYRIDLGRQ